MTHDKKRALNGHPGVGSDPGPDAGWVLRDHLLGIPEGIEPADVDAFERAIREQGVADVRLHAIDCAMWRVWSNLKLNELRLLRPIAELSKRRAGNRDPRCSLHTLRLIGAAVGLDDARDVSRALGGLIEKRVVAALQYRPERFSSANSRTWCTPIVLPEDRSLLTDRRILEEAKSHLKALLDKEAERGRRKRLTVQERRNEESVQQNVQDANVQHPMQDEGSVQQGMPDGVQQIFPDVLQNSPPLKQLSETPAAEEEGVAGHVEEEGGQAKGQLLWPVPSSKQKAPFGPLAGR